MESLASFGTVAMICSGLAADVNRGAGAVGWAGDGCAVGGCSCCLHLGGWVLGGAVVAGG